MRTNGFVQNGKEPAKTYTISAPGHKSGEIVHVRLGSYDGERVRAEMV